jgi:glycosyltransferase involved in cell wall biosynthesis
LSARVTIALATYNGQEFLREFLESLSTIRPAPHELVVSDDGSSDGTLAILEEYAHVAAFPVRILRASGHQGLVGNFSRAIAGSSGDWIALADQDDVWRKDKLRRLVEAVERPGVMAAFSNADLVGRELEPLGYTVWQQVGLSEGWRKQFDRDRPWKVLFREPVVTGATLMFRRELLPAIMPIPDSWVHDGWISQIAASQGKIIAVPESLVLYRQHSGNLIGSRKLSTAEQIRKAKEIGRSGYH